MRCLQLLSREECPSALSGDLLKWIQLCVLCWFLWLTASAFDTLSSRSHVSVSQGLLTSVAPLTPKAPFLPCRRQDVVHSCALWVWHHHTWDVWHKVPSRLMSGPRWLPSCVGLLCAPRVGFSAHGFLTTACSVAKILQWKAPLPPPL